MEITDRFEGGTRSAWRAWLTEHHARAREIWLIYRPGKAARPGEITYLDAVEEALCFGWIDGIAKRSGEDSAQRFTPRRPRGSWTELNKARARRMIAAGRMTPAGLAILPDLEAFVVPAPILAAMRADDTTWAQFEALPELYRRVKVGNLAEALARDPEEGARKLSTFVEKTRAGVLYGNWDDRAMPRTPLDPSVPGA